MSSNVFVLTAGRTGSTTFAKACAHATNWTAGHETRARIYDRSRFSYPDRHIEVDPRLAWWLGHMDRLYPTARYVWLRRDPTAVAESTAARAQRRNSAIAHWPKVAFLNPKGLTDDVAAQWMVSQIDANIAHFLYPRNYRVVWIEEPKEDFARFWTDIGAEGDLDAALAEFDVRHNART